MFHIHDVFAMAIGKPHQQIMGQKNIPDKGDNHEKHETFDILAEREKKLFDEMETENPSFDSEREMTRSKVVAKEETEDSQRASKEDLVPARVPREQLFSKNGSLCRDTSPSSSMAASRER